MKRLLRRVWYLLNKRRLERELAEELALHRELTHDGKTFGNGTLARNQARDVWIAPWLQDAAQDVRFAVRLLAKDRRFTAAAVVGLALGIAATNTVFTFVDAALFKDLPFEQPRQLMAIATRDQRGRDGGASYQDFRDWQQSARTFAGMAAHTQAAVIVAEADRAAERLRGAYVSGDAFAVLRATPIVGRALRVDDDQPGAAAAVVLGESVWRRRYQRNPDVLGRTIRVNGVPSTVVGVMPERFGFPGTAEVWMPLRTMADVTSAPRSARTLGVIGRMADRTTVAQARAELSVVAERLAAEHPETNRGVVTTVAPPLEAMRWSIAQPLAVLMGAVLFVLLIACANVATLLLARAAQRSREIAIRASLGASRWRIVRQLMIESLMLALLGGAGGLLLSLYGVRYFGVVFDAREVAAPDRLSTPFWVDLSMDARIFGFVAAVCLGSAVVFGLAPALHASRTNTNDALKDGSRSAAGSMRANRWSGRLMVLELTLTVVLLSGAALVTGAFIAMYRTNLVVETTALLSGRIALPAKTYATPGSRKAFIDRLDRELLPAAGVTDATVASDGVFGSLGGGSIRDIAVDGHVATVDETLQKATYIYVGRTYMRTIGLRLQEGRGLTEADDGPGRPGALVNRAFADRFFPGVRAIGHRIQRAAPPSAAPATAGPWLTIVGIVPTLPQFGPRQLVVEPTIYAPLSVEPEPGRFVSLIARGSDARATASFLRDRVTALDPDVALYAVMTPNEILAGARWGPQMIAALFGSLAGIALMLSAVGLFALTAHSVTQRTQEIGVRMALGAQVSEVVWLFVRRTCLQVAIGIALGSAGALAVGPMLQSVLDPGQARDPVMLLLTSALLTGVAIAASAWPARRAARVDPVVALRYE